MTEYGPVPNQAAGHTPLFVDQTGLLVKSRDPQEVKFYERVQQRPRLLAFLPKYYGLTRVPDALSLLGDPSLVEIQRKEAEDKLIMQKLTKLHRKLSTLDASTEEASTLHDQILALSLKRKEIGCNQTNLRVLKELEHSNVFIQLENISRDFSIPCTLDLKLGTRQHRDDASPDKVERMLAKCRYTTTYSLGIRIAGMRKLDGVAQVFDKYHGRTLSDIGLKDQLRLFFSSARCDVAEFRDSIRELRTVLRNEINIRLYSSSLLFVYEGDESRTQRQVVRLIDFAHAYIDEPQHAGVDEGALFGLDNLLKIMDSL